MTLGSGAGGGTKPRKRLEVPEGKESRVVAQVYWPKESCSAPTSNFRNLAVLSFARLKNHVRRLP
jgi:hypothetical protein